jgi:DNA polymerase III epsilon subunit-like protein
MEKVLVFDIETSGLKVGTHQIVSIGLIAANKQTFKTIEKLYVELKFDGTKYQWSKAAEDIHGLTRDYLDKNGLEHEEACEQIAGFIYNHFGTNRIITLTHNGHNFDIPFLNHFLNQFDIFLNYHTLQIDSAAVGCVCLGVNRSDDLFETLGLNARNSHNALTDAEMTLESMKLLKSVFL